MYSLIKCGFLLCSIYSTKSVLEKTFLGNTRRLTTVGLANSNLVIFNFLLFQTQNLDVSLGLTLHSFTFISQAFSNPCFPFPWEFDTYMQIEKSKKMGKQFEDDKYCYHEKQYLELCWMLCLLIIITIIIISSGPSSMKVSFVFFKKHVSSTFSGHCRGWTWWG